MSQSFIQDSPLSKDLAKDITKVAKGAGTTLIGRGIGGGLFFITQVAIARFLGVEVFGLYVLGLTVLKITELFSTFGLHTGGMRFVSMYRKESPSKVKGTLISAISISFFNGIILGGLLFLSAGFISAVIFHKPELRGVIQAFALCVPFMASVTVVANVSRGFHTMKYAVYIRDVIQPSSNLALIFLFISLGLGLSGVIYSFVISHVIGLIAGLHLANIMTYFKHRITNATSEGINSKIQTIKLMACGYRNREHYKTAIYFHCGGLDLYPRVESA